MSTSSQNEPAQTQATLSPERLAEIKDLLRYESSISFQSHRAKESMLLLVAEIEQWWATYGRDALPGALSRMQRAEAEAERGKTDRSATLTEAIQAARSEYLTDATGHPEDDAYNQGVTDAIAAIGKLLDGGAL